MAYSHGVYKSEVPTSLVPPVRTEAGLPVFVGTAPIHLGSSPKALENVNKPQLCYTYEEAVSLFGFSKDFAKYTLCEAIYSQFALFNVSPVVLINVFNPSEHKTGGAEAVEYDVKDGAINFGPDILLDDIEVIKADGAPGNPVAGTDYALSYNKDAEAIFTVIPAGMFAQAAKIKAKVKTLTPEAVDAEDVIGGVDVETGEYTGLELVDRVFPKFRVIPGLLAAPKWSENPSVAAVMAAKMSNINGHFTGESVADIPSHDDSGEGEAGAAIYTDAPEWKNKNNYMLPNQIVCWGKPKLGDDTFHLSTQLVSLMNRTDAGNEDIPYESPSNKSLQMNSLVNAQDEEILLGPDQAAYLNGQGIVTALNFIGGWKAWGNREAVYPAVTDPKDAFIPIRRMFHWIGNEFILTFWQKVDKPMTRRLVRTIVNSYNVRLNGLAAREFILGGRVEFLEDENPLTDLIDGILRFHVYVTPPPPAKEIRAILEFDPVYFNTLFE